LDQLFHISLIVVLAQRFVGLDSLHLPAWAETLYFDPMLSAFHWNSSW
jgi:hypothetical protein